MRIGFIVAEYNPLHNGHIKHIRQTKNDLSCDAIVCVMSGDFVQRGEVAIADKYTRARWAIEAGADLVVELPVEFVLGSAQIFADGAAKVIDYFDCEKYISFGSECGSEYVLQKIAEIMESEEFQSYLHDTIQDGNNYARSLKVALEKYLDIHGIDKSIAEVNTDGITKLFCPLAKVTLNSSLLISVKSYMWQNKNVTSSPALNSIVEFNIVIEVFSSFNS